MKKIKVSLLILFIICLCNFTKVLAAEPTVVLNVDKTTIKPGDTVTATIDASCDEGLSFIGTKIEYDTNVLTLQSKTAANNWIDYGIDKLELFINTETKTTNATVYTLVFKVNDNVTEETKISATAIEVTDANNKEYTKPNVEKTLTIVNEGTNPDPEKAILKEIKITKTPTKTTYTAGEKFETAGMEITAIYSDGTTKNVTDYTFTPSGALATTDSKIIITYKENGIEKTIEQTITVNDKKDSNEGTSNNKGKEENKDKTATPEKNLPQAGISNNILVIALLSMIAITTVIYTRYKKYKKI